jgi:hypothetical protein
MPFPKLSAVLNNCPLHALTPEIKEELLKYRNHADYDNKHNADYLLLKDKFATFYGFNPAEFSWKQFADILESYNAFDTQIIMGPVLRLFMKDKIATNDFLEILAEAHEVSPAQFIKDYTEIKPTTARYESLAPDELFTYVGKYLGLSLQYTPQNEPSRLTLAQDPVAQVNIFHHGGIDGAQSGGHWERTDKGEGSTDFQNQDNTQLNHLLLLLGQEAAVNPYGFDLLKKHVQLTALSLKEKKNLYKEFAELITSTNQISQYLFNINSVPRTLAIKLLGSDLTVDAAAFISEYKFEEVHPHQIYERWINADASQKPNIEEYEQVILNRLLMPVIAASSVPTTSESKSELTQAQTDFITREQKDSRLFDTWYDNEDVLRLVWVMHQGLPKAQKNQFMDPYVFFDTYNTHDIDEEIALCAKQLVEATNRRYYPFIIKPEIGSAHYYAGIIRKDIVKGEPRLTTFLFNPTGSPEQVVQKLKLPSHVLIGGESLVLSPHQVQTKDKDNGRLVSCGPLCVELIAYALQNPGWIDSLDERFVLPPKLQQIKDSSLEEYQASIMALRSEHYQALAKVPDEQLSTILDDHLTFSTFIVDELKAKARRKQRDLPDDPFDYVDPDDYEANGEDISSFSSDGESEHGSDLETAKDKQLAVAIPIPQPVLAPQQNEEGVEEIHAPEGENNPPLQPSDDGLVEQQPIAVTTIIPHAEQEVHALEVAKDSTSSSSDEENTPDIPLTSDNGTDEQTIAAILTHTDIPKVDPNDEPLKEAVVHSADPSSDGEDNPTTEPSDDGIDEQQLVPAILQTQPAMEVIASSSSSDVEEYNPKLADNVDAHQVRTDSEEKRFEREQPAVFAEETPPVVDTRLKPVISQTEKEIEKKFKLGALDKKITHLSQRLTEAERNNDAVQCRNLREAYLAAKHLKSNLTAAGVALFNNPTKEQHHEFKKSCDGYFKKAHKILDQHRGWSEFLINLAIGIFTGGLGLLIKGGINLANRHSFFHVHKTASAQILDDLEESVKDASKIVPGA